MATSTAQIRDLLFPGLNHIFGDYDQLPAQWSEIFEKNTSDMAYEKDVEVKLLGLAQLREEGRATSYEDMGERYAFTYRHIQIALGFVMTKNAIRDNLYKSQFGPSTRALKHSFRQTKEVYGAAVLNNANDTTGVYYGGDGAPLLSTNHPIDNGTVANTFAVQAELSETAIQDAVIGARRFRDAAGLRVMIKGRKLVVPTELQFTAERILQTTGRVGTSDNDMSAIRSLSVVPGGYTINDFLTNPRSWYLVTDVSDGLKFFQRDPMETDMKVDFDTDNLLTKATERFSFGWSNFRAVFGCMP